MALEKKDDKSKQDLPKLTEQHEGLPGYLDNAEPAATPAEPGDKAGR